MTKILPLFKLQAISCDILNTTNAYQQHYQHFLFFPHGFLGVFATRVWKVMMIFYRVNPLPHMLILGSSYSSENEDMMSKILDKLGYNFLIV